MQQFDLVIVGAGLAGASLAVALREARLKIALVEGRAPCRSEAWDPRIYAVSPANGDFLERIGVWKHLEHARIEAIRGMEIAGDQGGHLQFSAFAAGVPELGWVIESSRIACELWECVKRQGNVELFSPAQPAALEFRHDAALLRLDDGRLLSSRLLVAADGRDSWVRRTAGLPVHQHDYREKGVVANFSCAKPHRGLAWQWFGADSILAYLPLPGQHMSMVWSLPEARADALCALPPEILAQRVEEAGGGVLGALETVTPASAFPLRLMRVPRTVAPRLALVGDAAHGIHPLSGHGINLGFRDATELASLLLAAQPWQDIGDEHFLRRYQRARREETVLMQETTDALWRLFRAQGSPLAYLRNLGMGLTDRSPWLKNLLIRYALGRI
ncbi:MAG: UbiH/UbiF family hydroxylase [Azonexus sp.]|nr:UbiH/UbiF family hydroxylase [Azonexus sp.]MCK6413233.1 UbiH/UbiF family hydroxylase [Azonexus sp.]